MPHQLHHNITAPDKVEILISGEFLTGGSTWLGMIEGIGTSPKQLFFVEKNPRKEDFNHQNEAFVDK